MAVKVIDPQLLAYYEQLKHPMPDYLQNVEIHNIHDTANMRYNERLWQQVKIMNDEGKSPAIHEFRRIAADIRRTIDIELYECDNPDRFSVPEIIHRAIDAQVALSPVNVGAPGNQDEDSSPRGPIVLMVTVSFSTRGLSRVESRWIKNCFIDHAPDENGGDHSLVIGSTITVDSLDRVDRWLPRRVKRQILSHMQAYANLKEIPFQVPLKFRLQSLLGHIF